MVIFQHIKWLNHEPFQETNMTTLWSFNSLLLDMAIEFVDLPIKNGDYVIVHSFFSIISIKTWWFTGLPIKNG